MAGSQAGFGSTYQQGDNMNEKSNDPLTLWLTLAWIGLPIAFVIVAIVYQFLAIMGFGFAT